jgi:hypothetical protein
VIAGCLTVGSDLTPAADDDGVILSGPTIATLYRGDDWAGNGLPRALLIRDANRRLELVALRLRGQSFVGS